ncbi:unnamed protein product [Arabis nemorensis]|uniref:Uncharacterized protein n=1 Tax=Arabis nemorensis TaxID=586526 RepID=A0A565BTY9_9BRAS|nr:unnamed protein product [Arabis nemorensis]
MKNMMNNCRVGPMKRLAMKHHHGLEMTIQVLNLKMNQTVKLLNQSHQTMKKVIHNSVEKKQSSMMKKLSTMRLNPKLEKHGMKELIPKSVMKLNQSVRKKRKSTTIQQPTMEKIMNMKRLNCLMKNHGMTKLLQKIVMQ